MQLDGHRQVKICCPFFSDGNFGCCAVNILYFSTVYGNSDESVLVVEV